MEKEFRLDKKITNVVNLNNEDISSIPVKYVKEFIKRLKEECNKYKELTPVNVEIEIDTLAGDKLI